MREQGTGLDSVDSYGNELEEKIIHALETEINSMSHNGDTFLERFFIDKEGE